MFNSTALTDGVITIYSLINNANKGDMPNYTLDKQYQSYFAERSISYNRQYLAKGVNEQIDCVVRIADLGYRPFISQVAVLYGWALSPNDVQYRIDNVQFNYDDDGQRVYDLTLARLEDYYVIN